MKKFTFILAVLLIAGSFAAYAGGEIEKLADAVEGLGDVIREIETGEGD